MLFIGYNIIFAYQAASIYIYMAIRGLYKTQKIQYIYIKTSIYFPYKSIFVLNKCTSSNLFLFFLIKVGLIPILDIPKKFLFIEYCILTAYTPFFNIKFCKRESLT